MKHAGAHWRRRIVRHGVLGILSLCLLTVGPLVLTSSDPLWKVSVTAGWGSVVLVVVTLALGPLNVIRRRANPVSFDLRRDTGIWAAVLGVVHSAVGLLVHFRGRPWVYFVWPADRAASIPLRYDLFGAAAWSGLVATAVIVGLGAISNDLALRRMGTGRWKNLQRANYLLFGLVILHGVAFQILEKRRLGVILLLGALAAFTLIVQWRGFAAYRMRRRDMT